MTYKTKPSNRTNEISEARFSGKTDCKGRLEGFVIRTWECDFIDIEEGDHVSYNVKPGHYFSAFVKKTKNGEMFGGTKPANHFNTREERDNYVDKRLGN